MLISAATNWLAFAATLAPYTPEWAYPETGIAPDVIRDFARVDPAIVAQAAATSAAVAEIMTTTND